MKLKYGVIIVGGGHAGMEAALASARIGVNTLLITSRVDTIGELSCNPSIGGVGKGHLVKEIDALGGLMGMAADASGINFKTLNFSKGAAVQSTRIQVDRLCYKNIVFNFIKNCNNLTILQQTVVDVIIENNVIIGVITQNSLFIYCNALILTVGTFLNGKIFIGNDNFSGGRIGEKSSILLSNKLKSFFPVIGRLKTGTPPRIDIRSINLKYLGVQKSDYPIPRFSTWGHVNNKIRLKNCYITYTNNDVHNIILNSIKFSSIYNGSINVIGPRYCPSIEDKILKFSSKINHQIFLEPESLNGYEFYPNGISTSLPVNVQIKFLKMIKGFENILITRPGYAVEYDFFDPRILNNTMETKFIKGLFLAGQINGTTGYEEAGAQGIIAGINAAQMVLNKNAFILSRTNSYIGVLIDDLVNKGIDEPYRMFTSRVEYRIGLREDNADIRLVERARNIGLINEYKWQKFLNKIEGIKKYNFLLKNTSINIESNEHIYLKNFFNLFIIKNFILLILLKNQKISYKIISFIFKINIYILKFIEIQLKYSGYIIKQNSEIKKINKFKQIKIPDKMKYNNVSGLSLEIKEKLNLIKPKNLNQVAKIPGVSFSCLLILLIYIRAK